MTNEERWDLLLGRAKQSKSKSTNNSETENQEKSAYNEFKEYLNDFFDEEKNSSINLRGVNERYVNLYNEIPDSIEEELRQIIKDELIDKMGVMAFDEDPDLLDDIKPTASLISILLDRIDDFSLRTKDKILDFIQKFVDQINLLFADEIISRFSHMKDRRHGQNKRMVNLDLKSTIKNNLGTYNRNKKKLFPDRFYFHDNVVKSEASKKHIFIVLDISGSMSESIVYTSIIASILSKVRSLKTKFFVFNDEVKDVSHLTDNAVELVTFIQAGGGTNIEKCLTFVSEEITYPEQSYLFLISDLCDNSSFVTTLKNLKNKEVKTLVLNGIWNSDNVAFDRINKVKVEMLDIKVCSPSIDDIPSIMEDFIKGA